MFWSKNKKKVYPCKPQFYYIKVGCKGVFVTRSCFRDGIWLIGFGYIFYTNYTIYAAINDVADQSIQMCRLLCAFVVHLDI